MALIMTPNISPSDCNSSGTVARPDVAQLDVDRDAMSSTSAVMLKLTDECLAAIRKAQKHRLALRIRIEQRGGVIEVGSGDQLSKFRFVVQQVPGPPADAVFVGSQKQYCTIATYQTKIQVQTTEKALAETREKAQKLMEEEKRKKLNEKSKQKREHRPVTVKRATNPMAIVAQRPSPTAPVRSHNSESTTKVASAKVSSNHSKSTTSMGARSIVRAELSRRPLRKRVIHLVVLARFHSVDEIISQYKKGSISEENAQDDAYRIQEVVEEVADVNKTTGRLQLKQAYHNEVDARWPGFCSEEKSYVRKILSGNIGNNITNFAPTRKSGIAPMLAPTSVAGHTTTAEDGGTADTAPAPRITENRVVDAAANKTHVKSPVQMMTVIKNDSNENKTTDDLNSNAVKVKRKAHKVASYGKRPRNQSLSPPEDPSNANLAMQSQAKTATNGHPATEDDQATEATALPIYSIPAPTPSRDWSKEYGEVHSLADAEKYYVKFLEDYPTYLNYYNRLSAISDEFARLGKQLAEAMKNSSEHEKMENVIRNKYLRYQQDPSFHDMRQRHTDLRTKLLVLKSRIAVWEENYTKEKDDQCKKADDKCLKEKTAISNAVMA